jgi:hypothetical protein
MVQSRGGSIEEMQEGAFKDSGTMVRTVIAVIPAELIAVGDREE